jgi:hypothetical protein
MRSHRRPYGWVIQIVLIRNLMETMRQYDCSTAVEQAGPTQQEPDALECEWMRTF